MKIVDLTILGKPFGKQRPRVTTKGEYAVAYTPKETVSYENLIKMTFQEKYGNEFEIIDFPMYVKIIAYFGMPKSFSEKTKSLALLNKIRPGKNPDADNIAKVVLDALNKIAYTDDKLVVDLVVRKFYAVNPRVEIVIQKAKEIE